MAAFETKVAEKATHLELAEEEKSQMTGKMAYLREKLVPDEERLAELEVANVTLNTTQEEAITSRIATQEELNFCKSDRYKKNIVDDFKSLVEFNK